ncbi:Sec63 complex subunit SEC62 [Sporobolomyces salmoneus]|uniref:Sec63 complex subunit SEC62 n=1 Tax=Sporobolomyces salmoneus TaxID=183962 RepID=UPI00316FE997
MSGTNMKEQQLKASPQDRNVIDWLRNKSGIKIKTGALAGKRHDYFKGKAAIKALLSPAYAKLKNVPPPPSSKEAAREYLHSLIPYTFYLRIQIGPTISPSTKAIQINPQQLFQPDESYVWLIDQNPIKQLVLAAAMVLVVLAGVMFPLWPIKMRIGVWYLSVGVLGLIAGFFGLAIVRLIGWVITKLLVSPGIWLFPNLFADVGFVDSFIPLWSWDLPPTKKKSSSSSKKSKSIEGGEKKEKRSKKRKDATSSKVDIHEAAGIEDDEEEGGDGRKEEETSEGAKIIELTPDQAGDESDEE